MVTEMNVSVELAPFAIIERSMSEFQSQNEICVFQTNNQTNTHTVITLIHTSTNLNPARFQGWVLPRFRDAKEKESYKNR